jgi:hypothetical protein
MGPLRCVASHKDVGNRRGEQYSHCGGGRWVFKSFARIESDMNMAISSTEGWGVLHSAYRLFISYWFLAPSQT